MAELLKKLHIKRGTDVQTAKIYSTTAEAGIEYIFAKVDGVDAYICLGATNDERATKGRILKNGETKAILNSGKPPYTEQSWTTAGTYTWTCPAGVTRVRVAVCGGGGGGRVSYFPHGRAGSGGTSSVQSGSTVKIQATGGAGAYTYYRTIQDNDNNWTGHFATAGTGGTPNGNSGGERNSPDGTSTSGTAPGGAGFALAFTQNSGGYGQGGSATVNSYRGGVGGGGSGGYDTNYIDVTPLETLTIIVGAGGSGAVGGNSGASGFVFIAYGGDI